MNYTWDDIVVWWLLFIVSFLYYVLIKRRGSSSNRPYPPGPPGWPVIGNMLDLGTSPHETMYRLKSKYGPVLWLRLGSVNTMVVQSASAAAEFFKKHDANFSDRKCPVALTAHNINQGSLIVGQYGAYWRSIRRLCATELLANSRMNATAHVLRKRLNDMLRFVEKDSLESIARGESGEVNLARYLFMMAINVIGSLVLSKDLLDSQSKEVHDFFEATSMVSYFSGKPNIADFFPILKRMDPQGIKKGMEKAFGRALEILEGFIKEKREEQKLGRNNETKDFLDLLLEHEWNGPNGPEKISDHNAKIIALEMFFAASDTTSTTLEWTMAELLRDPDCMRKAKEELDRVIGPDRNVEETDIDKLPYLQAVLKESMRLHPALPLLVPRKAINDTTYMGYYIPKDTTVFVNVWAIGRDPCVWDDPLAFKPERFLGSNIDYRGQTYELMPFGSGRRSCAGIPLAHRLIQLALASLLHYFDWELRSGLTPETMDMSESVGITVCMRTHLKVIPKKRCVTMMNFH